MTDAELIREYRQGSHDAFTVIVRRHIDWVYSAAKRRVGDAHIAEDMVQSVFMSLATHPPAKWDQSSLAPWLFGILVRACKMSLRTDASRRRRETTAAQVNQAIQSTGSEAWQDLAPQLEEMVGRLRAPDRDLILLRFYEQKSFPEIAQMLQLSEEAARKRVSRAIQTLKAMGRPLGSEIPTAMLVGLLTNATIKQAPAGLATSVCGFSHNAPGMTSAALWKGVVGMIAVSKSKMVIVPLAILLFLIGTAAILHPLNVPAPVPAKVTGKVDLARESGSSHSIDDPNTRQFLNAIIRGNKDTDARISDGVIYATQIDQQNDEPPVTSSWVLYRLGAKRRIDTIHPQGARRRVFDGVGAFSLDERTGRVGVQAKDIFFFSSPAIFLNTMDRTRTWTSEVEHIENLIERWDSSANSMVVESKENQSGDAELVIRYTSTRGGGAVYEWTFQPSRGYQLTRGSETITDPKGTQIIKLSCEFDIQEAAPGVWFPVQVMRDVEEQTPGSPTVLTRTTIRLTKVAINTAEVNESYFSVTPAPSTSHPNLK